MRKIAIFGSTGSIGRKTIEVLLRSNEKCQVEVLTANTNIKLLEHQARLVKAKNVVVVDDCFYKDLKQNLSDTDIKVYSGKKGLLEACFFSIDWAMVSITGIAALEPTIYLIKSAVPSIALANKESIVCGGNLLLGAAKRNSVKIIPVDSEHNAIFQIFSYDSNNIKTVTLTASGGPFLNYNNDFDTKITPEMALEHPIWGMGKKISIDSATMVNKSLEIIEAYHLFALKEEQIKVIVHPESIIHGIVSYQDGTSIAVMSNPDMAIPIEYSLYWPNRSNVKNSNTDLILDNKLTFIEPDYKKFPALSLGGEILRSKNIQKNSIVFNAANEVAVEAFLQGGIPFSYIVNIIKESLSAIDYGPINSMGDIFDCDSKVKNFVKNIIGEKSLLDL